MCSFSVLKEFNFFDIRTIELVIIVLCDFVYFVIGVCMCGFCTVWMCEAYVILWVGIWWVTAFLDYSD